MLPSRSSIKTRLDELEALEEQSIPTLLERLHGLIAVTVTASASTAAGTEAIPCACAHKFPLDRDTFTVTGFGRALDAAFD